MKVILAKKCDRLSDFDPIADSGKQILRQNCTGQEVELAVVGKAREEFRGQ